MIDTDTLTESALEQRFAALPPSLQKALTSDANIKAVARVCVDNRITDQEEVLTITQLAAFVMMGFVSPDELGVEIDEALELRNPTLAGAIAEQLNARVFSSIKSDIVNNFQPLPSGDDADAGAVMADISPSPTAASSVVQPAFKSSVAPAGMAAAAGALDQKGWSKLSPNDPIMKVTVIRPASSGSGKPSAVPMPMQAPVPLSSMAPSKAAAPQTSQAPRMPQAPVPPQAVPKPASAPVILQENKQFGAAAKNPDFRIAASNTGAQMELGGSRASAPRVMPAVVEFAKGNTPIQPPQRPAERPAGSMSPLASSPIARSDSRNVTEMTSAAMPTPAAPPIPRPPSPPEPSAQGKVIIKNFTDGGAQGK